MSVTKLYNLLRWKFVAFLEHSIEYFIVSQFCIFKQNLISFIHEKMYTEYRLYLYLRALLLNSGYVRMGNELCFTCSAKDYMQ